VRSVIMVDDNDVAIGVVAADVAPIDRASAHQKCQQRRDGAAYGSLTPGA